MIDTMIFDVLAADDDAREATLRAVREGRLCLLTTLVQEHQLADIGDVAKRKRLQRIPREVVPSAAPVVGVARTGHARLRPDAERRYGTWGTRHSADDIIADAALARADVLVTEDNRLFAAAQAQGITVWRVGELVAWAQSDAG